MRWDQAKRKEDSYWELKIRMLVLKQAVVRHNKQNEIARVPRGGMVRVTHNGLAGHENTIGTLVEHTYWIHCALIKFKDEWDIIVW